jgi:hypothetical protein
VVEPSHISRYGRMASGRRASPKRERGLRTSSAVSVTSSSVRAGVILSRFADDRNQLTGAVEPRVRSEKRI